MHTLIWTHTSTQCIPIHTHRYTVHTLRCTHTHRYTVHTHTHTHRYTVHTRSHTGI